MLRALPLLTDDAELFLKDWPDVPQVHHGDRSRFAALLNQADLRRFLNRPGDRPPEVGMVRNGQLTGEAPDADHASSTFAVNGLHETWAPLVDFTRILAAELGHRVTANAYRTLAASRGYNFHWDTYHVFLAQVHGVKKWAAWRPVVADPLERHRWTFVGFSESDRERIAREPDFTTTLAPGDVLFLPRGWVHEGHTTDTTDSLHITLGVHLTTWHALAVRLVDLAAEDERVRGALPPALGHADPVSVRRVLTERVTAWLAGVDPDLITELTRLPERR